MFPGSLEIIGLKWVNDSWSVNYELPQGLSPNFASNVKRNLIELITSPSPEIMTKPKFF